MRTGILLMDFVFLGEKKFLEWSQTRALKISVVPDQKYGR